MEFRDLHRQYNKIKGEIDVAILEVIKQCNFISGKQVSELEKDLAHYVGVKHCVACGNGTDALLLSLLALGVKKGDAVFVPDFTFFSTAEVVAQIGAMPVFVDIEEDTFNMDPQSLADAIECIIKGGKYTPKVVIPVDLFGQPADYNNIQKIADKFHLKIIEDGAQGFGGKIYSRAERACGYGDVATTSFFPSKPIGCYGDGGAIFTNIDEKAELLRSLRVHGKGEDKYDNIRIGMNSRLDTIQAAILREKLKIFNEELDDINKAALLYTERMQEIDAVKTPITREGYTSSWAQYTIRLENEVVRDGLKDYLSEYQIPCMIYYRKPLHEQKAFQYVEDIGLSLAVSQKASKCVLSLPISPYITVAEQEEVVYRINKFFNS